MDQVERTRKAFENPGWYLGPRDYNIRLRAEIVREFTRASRFDRILDIGCGDGSISLPLLTPNNELTLLDLSSSMLKIARSRIPNELRGQVEIVNANLMEAQLQPESYDLIICVGLLAYIGDLKSVCSKLRSLLTPKGMAIVECTDASHFMSRLTLTYGKLRGLFGSAKVPLCLRPSLDVERALQEVGFQLLQTVRYVSPLPIVTRLFSQSLQYRIVRSVFGCASHNRNSWLGNECISCFSRES
jgi:ubiquinone/menaquinone biosynthesis C-methylase UbiE